MRGRLGTRHTSSNSEDRDKSGELLRGSGADRQTGYKVEAISPTPSLFGFGDSSNVRIRPGENDMVNLTLELHSFHRADFFAYAVSRNAGVTVDACGNDSRAPGRSR